MLILNLYLKRKTGRLSACIQTAQALYNYTSFFFFNGEKGRVLITSTIYVMYTPLYIYFHPPTSLPTVQRTGTPADTDRMSVSDTRKLRKKELARQKALQSTKHQNQTKVH